MKLLYQMKQQFKYHVEGRGLRYPSPLPHLIYITSHQPKISSQIIIALQNNSRSESLRGNVLPSATQAELTTFYSFEHRRGESSGRVRVMAFKVQLVHRWATATSGSLLEMFTPPIPELLNQTFCKWDPEICLNLQGILMPTRVCKPLQQRFRYIYQRTDNVQEQCFSNVTCTRVVDLWWDCRVCMSKNLPGNAAGVAVAVLQTSFDSKATDKREERPYAEVPRKTGKME